MGRVIVRINKSPFYRRERDANRSWIGIPSRIGRNEIFAKTTQEQATMIWNARIFFERNMQSWLYHFIKRGKLSNAQYTRIRTFIRAFIFTPRVENGITIYRAPTLDELKSAFRYLGAVLQHSHQSEKTREYYARFYPK
ncbi:MAG: hypothetical protein V1776_04965 [Candidatus Diapherotrites archaeon]